MNIRNVSNLASSLTGLNIRRRIFDCLPNMTVAGEALAGKFGTILSRPDVSRGILGATALLTQPFIDYYNPHVDEDTATVSTCRTVGKIVAGTTVGCIVRSACYYGSRALTNLNPNAKEWQKFLLPTESMIQYLNKRNPDWIKNYRSSLALCAGLAALLITNVVLDVPLTNYISKKLLKWFRNEKTDDVKNPAISPMNNNSPQSIQDKFRNRFEDYRRRETCALPNQKFNRFSERRGS